MPEPDFRQGDARCWEVDFYDNTTIEQWGSQGWAKAAEAEAEVERLQTMLRHIRRHQEIACPTGYTMSATWILANQALTPKETTDAPPKGSTHDGVGLHPSHWMMKENTDE